MLAVFKRAKLRNPYFEATSAINVQVVIEICPELQAMLSLSSERRIPMRRYSTEAPRKAQKVSKRRMSMPANGTIQFFFNDRM